MICFQQDEIIVYLFSSLNIISTAGQGQQGSVEIRWISRPKKRK
jgi:hypothetical protein